MDGMPGTGLLVGAMLAGLAGVAVAAAEPIATESMVVTGTRIQQAEPMGVATLDREQIERSGAVSVTGLSRDLIFNAAGTVDEQFTQGFAPASAAIDLRGLGVNRTLVLLNGRRLPVFPFAQNGSESFVDINLIPLVAVSRVDVLNDGASAVYGADAVAGVVNIVTRDARSPNSVSGRYSAAAEGDGEETYLTLAAGATLGQADLSMAFEYLDRNPIMARDRDISSSAYGPIDDRSDVGNPGTFITSSGPVPDAACPADSLRGPFCAYDFAPAVTLVPGVERLGLHGSWDQALSSEMGFFLEAMYSTSDSQRDLAAAPNAYPVAAATPNNPFGEDVLALYRVTEFGPRRDRFETDAYNFSGGLRGIAAGWSWEAVAGRSQVDTSISGVSGYARMADVQAAIDAGILNVFGASPNLDPTALRYQTQRDGLSELTYLQASASGNLFEMRHGAAGGAVGIEWRDETFSDEFDNATANGEVIGVGGVSAEGQRDVWAAYAELVLPVLAGVELQLAGRYDHYSDFGGTFNPKLGVHWQVTGGLVVRGTAGTGFKAPALHELYSGDILAFDSVFDTTNCEAARTANDPAGIAAYCDNVQEVLFAASGNEALDAEQSDHLTIGADWAVTDFFEVTVDYWWLENQNAITSSPQFYIDNESEYPGNVVRDPGGDIAMVMSPFQNVAAQKLWGVDTSFQLALASNVTGSWDLNLATTWLGEFEQQSFAGEAGADLAGIDGHPSWRAQARLLWTRAAYDAQLTLHHIDGYERVNAQAQVDAWTTMDLQLGWTPTLLRGGALALGLDNAFDEAPPEDPFLGGYPFFNRALHDPRGRFFYLRYSHGF